jgi:hypothetical protein
MPDPNTIPVVPLNPAPTTTDDPDRALTGKIARLPHDIREQLNQRLHDGQGGPEILAWLNRLPAVKEILAAQFNGAEINAPNLTLWRQNGYHRWLRQKQCVTAAHELRRHAIEMTNAADGQLAPAAASVASGKILEFLEAADAENTDPNNLVKCAAAASVLQKMEQNNARIRLANQRLRQHDMQLLLKRDKQQRDTVTLTLRFLNDARAKQIAAASATYAEKIELLGHHMYNHLWEPRLVPEDPNPSNQTP